MFKMNLLENVNVFCVSPAGVHEGSQLLTLVTCRPSPFLVGRDQRRTRTNSLPSEFEEDFSVSFQKCDFNNGHKSKNKTGRQLIRRTVSDYILRRGSEENLEDICTHCIRSMVKLPKKRCNPLRSKSVSGKRKSIKAGFCNSLVGHHKTGLQSPGTAFKVDGYELSYFIAAMKRSHPFRLACIEHWSKNIHHRGTPKTEKNLLVIVALMKRPKSEVLDLLGNKMVNSNILFRRSLEHALSWLSTLGGAFSALGDLSTAYAEEAAHVSLTQLRIALKLGDPGIQSRCRLYAAISLLQRGFLRSCRDIVKSEYRYAISLPEGADPRLRRMCLGIWAKLQYQWKLAGMDGKKGMMLNTTSDGLEDIRNNAKYWNVYDLEENRRLVVSEPIDESLLLL